MINMATGSANEHWLFEVIQVYRRMSDAEKNYMLSRLLRESSFSQLYFLQHSLHKIRHQDFMVLLPKEILEHIMSFLDLNTLCTCCQVSKTWNAFIQSCHILWKSKCQSLGLRIAETVHYVEANGSESYKQICLRMARQMHLMKTHRGFQNERYHSHVVRITAVCFWENRLATGREDGKLIIWDTEMGHILHAFNMSSDICITCITFDNELLLAGSSTGFLQTLDMKQMQHQKLFGQFSAAIFAIDFSSALNLAVSGSADNLIKLWSLPQGLHVGTLHGHCHWVVKVLLRPWHYSSGLLNNADAVLISMDKERVLIWPVTKNIQLMPSHHVASIPLENNPLSFFTPGLCFRDHYIYFIQQDLGNSSSTRLCKYDLLTNTKVSAIKINLQIKTLLALGAKYLMVVTPHCHDPNMFILDIETLQEVAQWTLPLSRSITPDHPQIACGCTDWLDGLNGYNSTGVVIVIGLECGDVVVVKWREEKRKYTLKYSKNAIVR